RRLAPKIYLKVVEITGSKDKPSLKAPGKAIEYAVKMKQFPQAAQLDNMLASGKLNTDHIDAIAHMVAEFHKNTDVADDTTEYGSNKMVNQPVEENFSQIKEHLDTGLYADKLLMLEQWCNTEFLRLKTDFERRKQDGFIRECHGDMHLRNLLWLDDHAIAFDCIEFNPKLRWIDVISEVAFLVMDLHERKQQRLANHFLNAYLELSGDYEGLSVLPFYLCYRALVRTKVNALRLEQKDLTVEEKKTSINEFESYLDLAITYSQQTKPKVIIMRGLSASGKSTVSQQLLDVMGGIRIRSDVERKRLFGISPSGSAADNIKSGIYSSDASALTYKKLIELTSLIIKAGYSVIVDAAFLKHEQRRAFQELSEELGMSYKILDITAPSEVMRQRIRQRKDDVSDADLTVLEHQLTHSKPLYRDEEKYAVSIDTSKVMDIDLLIEKINR
ncbi:MAG: AAA family ATPase, partial [Proteobacteria bacterium]|nr:AAA family ATPase [Pseudomonadota bacterium]